MEQRYGIQLQGGSHQQGRAPAPRVGAEASLLTAGQVRGFEAQQEIRTLRGQAVAQGRPDPLDGLHPTNDGLHAYVGGINSCDATEDRRRAGAAMQGHGLVHTARNPGEVLLGSRQSRPYQALADRVDAHGRGEFRTANVLNWNIHRNDAFMAGALLGENRFSVPLQNPRRDYIANGRDLPGRVTIREIAQVQEHAQLSPRQPNGQHFENRANRFELGRSQPIAAGVRANLHRTMATIGDDVQQHPDAVFRSIPHQPPPQPPGGGRGGDRGGNRGGGNRGGGRGGRGRRW